MDTFLSNNSGDKSIMKASSEIISTGDDLIFNVDEYRRGKKEPFDGTVISVQATGVDVIYLSGHRSRNDFIPWCDIIAKADLKMPKVTLENAPFTGHFLIFEQGLE